MSDTPPDTTLSTEMGKLSDIVQPTVGRMRGEGSPLERPAEEGLGAGGRHSGLADTSTGLAGLSTGLAERGERGIISGSSSGERPDASSGVPDPRGGLMGKLADKLGAALPGDRALGGQHLEQRAEDDTGLASSGPSQRTAVGDMPATADIRGGYLDNSGDTGRGSVQCSSTPGSAAEAGLARAVDYAEKTEDISI